MFRAIIHWETKSGFPLTLYTAPRSSRYHTDSEGEMISQHDGFTGYHLEEYIEGIGWCLSDDEDQASDEDL